MTFFLRKVIGVVFTFFVVNFEPVFADETRRPYVTLIAVARAKVNARTTPNINWLDDPSGVKCLASTLPQPGNNGYYLGKTTEDALPGTTRQIRCNDGYSLAGASSVVCSANGEWSQPGYCLSIAARTRCIGVPRLANGYVASGLSIIGSVRSVVCNVGFTTRTPTIKCQDNGVWSLPSDCRPQDEPECPEIPTTPNGYFALKNLPQGATSIRTVGTVLELKCNSCYQKADPTNEGLTTCNPGRKLWTRAKNSCKLTECSESGFPVIQNARIEEGSVGCNTSRTVACNDGYTNVSGETKIVCQPDGQWSVPSLICVATTTLPLQTCSSLSYPKVENGHVEEGLFLPSSVGTTRNVVCDDGFQLLGGSSMISCQPDGTWSQPGTICSRPRYEKTCLAFLLPWLRNGYYLVLNNASPPGTVVKFACYTGFVVTGPSEITCGSDGKWTSPGSCIKPDLTTTKTALELTTFPTMCQISSLSVLRNGYYSGFKDNGSAVVTSVAVICFPGYNLVGPGNVTCTPDGNWTKAGTCGPLVPTATVSFTAIPGCLTRNLPPLVNGFFVTLSQVVATGDFVKVACFDNFMVSAPAEVQCTPTGTWTRPGRCIPVGTTSPETNALTVTCNTKSLPKVLNGYVKQEIADIHIAYPVNANLEIACNEGYTLTGGSNTTTCLKMGLWSFPFANCTLVPTPTLCNSSSLPLLANGFYHGLSISKGLPVGSFLKVQCNAMFTIAGPVNVTCLRNGEWTLPGSCISTLSTTTTTTLRPSTTVSPKITCNPLLYPKVENGQVSDANLGSNLVGTWRQVVCNQGYEFNGGSNITTCQSDGTWSQPGTVCSKVPPKNCHLDNAPFVANGFLEGFLVDAPIGTVVKVKCYEGYRIAGTPEMTCLSSGNWSLVGTCDPLLTTKITTTVPPITIATTCLGLNAPFINNGYLDGSVGNMVPIGTQIRVKCFEGYKVNGAIFVICLPSGEWSLPGSCQIPSKTTTTNQFPITTPVPATTVAVKTTASSPTFPTTTLKTAKCSVLDLPFVANGYLVTHESFVDPGTSVKVACYANFILKRPANVYCKTDGNWTDAPKCLPEATTITGILTFPTVMATVICSNNSLPKVENGHVEPSDLGFKTTYPLNAERPVACNDGYILTEGLRVTKCIGMNTWSDPRTICSLPTTSALTTTGAIGCRNDTFPKISNGHVEPGELGFKVLYPIGAVRPVVCDNGLEGTTTKCLGSGIWSDPKIECIVRATTTQQQSMALWCSNSTLPRVENGHVEPGEFGFKSLYPIRAFRNVACNEGFVFMGGSTSTECQGMDIWSDPMTKCVVPTTTTLLLTTLARNTCTNDTFPFIENGHVEPGEFGFKTTYPMDAVRPVACNEGYKVQSGSNSIQCLGHLGWTDPQLKCVLIATAALKPLTTTLINPVITPTCSNATLPKIENGHVEPGLNGFKLNYPISAYRPVVCDLGYVGGSFEAMTTRCLENGLWSDPKLVCVPTTTTTISPDFCTNNSFPIVENGHVEPGELGFKPRYPSGAIRNVACNNGYDYFSGLQTTTCMGRDIWTDPLLKCKLRTTITEPETTTTSFPFCTNSTLPRIVNGHVEPGELGFKTRYPASAYRSVVCNDGYLYNGGLNETRCTGNDNWSNPGLKCVSRPPMPITGCSRVTLPDFENGRVEPGDDFGFKSFYPINTVLQVSCNAGYQQIGPGSETKCLSNDTWSNPHLKCLRPATSPPDERITTTQPVEVAVATIRSFCSIKSLPVLENAHIDAVRLGVLKLVYPSNSILPLTCNTGFNYVDGLNFTKCVGFDVWTDPFLQCVSLETATTNIPTSATLVTMVTNSGQTCITSLPIVPNGNVEDGSWFVGSVRQIRCKTGFSVLKRTITCQSNGEWTVPDICVKITENGSCPEPPEVANGYWLLNKAGNGEGMFREVGAVLEMACESCFVRGGVGTPFIRCGTKRTWTQTQLKCTRVECPSGDLPEVENGKIGDGSSTCGSSRDILCNEGFTLSGSVKTIKCQIDSFWSSPTSLCRPKARTNS